MKKIIRCLSISLGLIAAFCAFNANDAHAARVRLTPQHLYRWAHDNNTTRLHQFKRYINLMDEDKNTALCLAQKAKDKKAYSLLLDYGASTKAPCHDDNDPVCAIIAGEKTKVHPAGWALLAAGAAAGAYLLLDDDDDKCDISQYPLEECPDHGICSNCENKKRLDDCEENWQPNDDRTMCVPVPCPAGEVTRCERKDGHTLNETATGNMSGDQKCYTCEYQCDTESGFYETDTACRTEYTGYTCVPMHGCYIKGFCDVAQGNYGTVEECETANRGYTCKPAGVDDGCWTKSVAKTCPVPSVPEKTCTTPATGIILTETETTDYAGEKVCVSCNYACDTAHGWETTCPDGKVCTTATSPDGLVCNTNPQCPTGQSFPDSRSCEEANPGYYCIESAPGSGCWGKNAANPKTCPVPEVTKGSCTAADSYHTLEETETDNQAGDIKCVTCNYGCATDYYDSESTCTTGGYTCTQHEQQGKKCWERTGSEMCPSDYPSRNKCTKDDSKYITTETSTSVGFETCYKCVYTCRPNESTCPDGKVCTEVSAPDGTICQQNPQCPTDHSYSSQSACEAANPGYNCSNSGAADCWKPQTSKQCTPPAVKEGTCASADGYHTLDERRNGEYEGSTPCVTCHYGCTNGYYSSANACTNGGSIEGTYPCRLYSTQYDVSCWAREGCPTQYPTRGSCEKDDTKYITNETSISVTFYPYSCSKCTYTCRPNESTCPDGKVCTEVSAPDGTICQQNPQCPTDYSYSSQSACETANPGYTCTESAAGTNCWGKGSEKSCTAPSVTEGTCAAAGIGFILNEEPTGDKTGTKNCVECEYACDAGNGYYSDETLCQKDGYICTDTTAHGLTCWKRTGSADCPDTHPSGTACSTGTGYTTTQDEKDVGSKTCYKCTYACDTANGYYSTCPAGKSCSDISTPAGTCHKDNGCPTGYSYSSQSACEAANPGYTCTESATGTNCWGKGSEKSCRSPYTTSAQTEAQCHTTGSNGWYIVQDTVTPLAGTLKCTECRPNECTGGSKTEYEDVNACPNSYTYLKVTGVSEANWHGDDRCYTCKYGCDSNKKAYTSSSLCTAGGYNCTTITENGTTCWIRGDESGCPAGYSTSKPNLASCGAGGEKGWNWTSSGTSGGVTCGKCEAKECVAPAVKTCATVDTYHTVTPTDSTTSYYGNTPCVTCTYGCASDYYDSESTCTTGGYTCTQHEQHGKKCWEQTGSSGCPGGYTAGLLNCNDKAHPSGWTYSSSGTSGGQVCGKCEALSCNSPYTTAAQTETDCGSTGTNGWTLPTDSSRPYAGDKKCTQCQKIKCNDGSSVDYASTDACPNPYTYLKPTGVDQANLNGDDRCYTCKYGCPYVSEAFCKAGGNTCIQITENGLTCWVRNSSSSTMQSTATTNNTTLSLTSDGGEDVYGLSGSTTLENSVNRTTGEKGVIDITHNSTGAAYGMRGTSNNRLINHEGAAIRIKNNAGGTAYGMYAAEGGTAYNRGEIKIEGTNGIAYGIYGEGQNSIDNSGTIDVSGRDAYGIYVKDGKGTDIFNSGTINVNASNEAHGIYVDKNGSAATITNNGTIFINNEEKPGDTGITLNGAKLKNASVMRFARAANFNTLGGEVYLEKGGVYEAESLSGDLNAGTSTVLGGNSDTYVAESVLKTEDVSGLNIASESAMFEAKIEKSQSGSGYNVTQERKNFAEFAPNSSIAEYLEQNYKGGFLENLFDKYKQYGDSSKLSAAAAKDLGYDILPNFADENYTVLKSLNRNIANTILEATDEENRVVAGYDNINWESDGKGFLSGSDLHANSMYTFGDKRLDNQNRLGLGLSFTKLSSNYDTGGDRDLSIVSVFMPYMHKFTDKLRLASILSLGYGYGEYEHGSNKESDISGIFYSFTNELRYTIDLNGFAELEPALMLNAIGYTEDDYDEGNGDTAIETKNRSNNSLEAGFGLFLKKSVQTEKYGKFGFKIGGIYYRELGSPYRSVDARLKNGNNMWYRVNDYANLYSHDRAIIEAAIDYEYKQIGVYLKYNRLIQKNDPELFDLGIKYNF